MKKLSIQEMYKIKGGNAHLKMDPKYRKKANCLGEAQAQIQRGIVTGMTELEIGQEIFAHAVAYYKADILSKIIPFIGDDVKNYLISHASIIDIMDGGDTPVRKAAYTAIWNFTGSSI
ncbi:MAG: hypothetical protein LBS02_08990 [Hungatella sp.]|jgi:hypothetical protein|nr:hypothetical protein [Hungatella sp.]